MTSLLPTSDSANPRTTPLLLTTTALPETRLLSIPLPLKKKSTPTLDICCQPILSQGLFDEKPHLFMNPGPLLPASCLSDPPPPLSLKPVSDRPSSLRVFRQDYVYNDELKGK